MDLALRIGFDRKRLDFLLLHATVFSAGDLENFQRPLRRDHRLPGQRGGGNGRLHLLACPGVASIRPDDDFERFSSSDHRSGATLLAAGGIHHAGLDGVFRVHVALRLLRRRSVDFDLRRAIRTDGNVAFHHQFIRRPTIPLPPRRVRRKAAPAVPRRVPGGVATIPPRAGAIEPIPAPHRKPPLAHGAAFHNDLDIRIPNGSPVEIHGLHRRREFITQLHRFRRGIHLHLIFRLAVFLHLQTNGCRDPVADLKRRVPRSEHRILGDDHFAFHRAEIVGFEFFDLHRFLATAVVEGELAILVSPHRFVRLEVADIAEIKLQVRGIARLVERPIRDAIREIAVPVLKLRLLDAMRLESEKRHGPVLLSCDRQPLIFRVQVGGPKQRFSILIRSPRQHLRAYLHIPFHRLFPLQIDRAIAEKLDLRPGHRSAARGIRHPPLFFPAHVVLHDHRVHDPHQRVK